jgi:photosystem II stability/assembly factor-like uncharacterized protein
MIADCGLRIADCGRPRGDGRRPGRLASRRASLSATSHRSAAPRRAGRLVPRRFASFSQSAIRNPQSAIKKLTVVAALLLVACPVARAEWSAQRSGTMAWLRAVHFVDGERGWAVGGSGALLSTEDGGRNWRVRARPADDTLRDVFFNDGATGWLVCERSIYALARAEEARSYLLRTTDGGASWSRVEVTADDPGVLLARVVFADAERGWAFGEMGALYSTRDGGRTWERRRSPTRRLLLGAALVGAERAWFVGAGGHVVSTDDGGARWRLFSPPAEPGPRLSAVSFADARHGWAVGQRGAVLATDNGGQSWRAQASGTDADLTDVRFHDAREGWAVGAAGTVLRTTDGGASWQTVPSGTRHNLERLAFAGRARGWAVGFGGTIIAYSDADANAHPRIKPADRP